MLLTRVVLVCPFSHTSRVLVLSTLVPGWYWYWINFHIFISATSWDWISYQPLGLVWYWVPSMIFAWYEVGISYKPGCYKTGMGPVLRMYVTLQKYFSHLSSSARRSHTEHWWRCSNTRLVCSSISIYIPILYTQIAPNICTSTTQVLTSVKKDYLCNE